MSTSPAITEHAARYKCATSTIAKWIASGIDPGDPCQVADFVLANGSGSRKITIVRAVARELKRTAANRPKPQPWRDTFNALVRQAFHPKPPTN